MSAHLHLVTDDDIPPAPLPARGQVPFAFATHVAPPQEHTRRCVYRTAGERRRLRARAARSRRHRKGQRGIVFGAARKGRTWSRARSYQDLRLRPEERAELHDRKETPRDPLRQPSPGPWRLRDPGLSRARRRPREAVPVGQLPAHPDLGGQAQGGDDAAAVDQGQFPGAAFRRAGGDVLVSPSPARRRDVPGGRGGVDQYLDGKS